MDLELLKQVNRLWDNIYPYLTSQIMEVYQRTSGSVLELGSFFGGISEEMAERHPDLDITIADEPSQLLDYFREEIKTKGLSRDIVIRETSLNPLVFKNSEFDLVICRGLFFFLDERGLLFKEIFRILKSGGLAFVGGGYGKNTPGKYIDAIADKSRELNDELGRKRVGIDELGEIIEKSGLAGYCEVVEEGGLWVIIEK